MIAYIKGKILDKGNGYVVVLSGDIGYKVFTSPGLSSGLEAGRAVEFYTYHQQREDSVNLYGFRDVAELELFELLLSVGGVGPKSALGVLSASAPAEIVETIIGGDPGLLIKVSGIGKKTAERIILELREKIGRIRCGGTDGKTAAAGGDEIDALAALGYSLAQARDALKKVDSGIKDSGTRVREALKNLGK